MILLIVKLQSDIYVYLENNSTSNSKLLGIDFVGDKLLNRKHIENNLKIHLAL